MFFDALTTMAVRDALRVAWLGARVQRIGLLGERAVGLELYAGGPRRWLILSAAGDQGRVQLGASAPVRNERVTPLLLLLRKYVRDARLVAVDQPPWERVLSLTFHGWETAQGEHTVQLIAEVTGRHANLILVGPDGAILDALRRVGPEVSRRRHILPHEGYVLPPPQAKLPPASADGPALARAAGEPGGPRPIWQVLVGAVAGVSPLLARELAYRATGDANATTDTDLAWQRAADALQAIVADAMAGRWIPCLGREGPAVVAFAPYELTQFAERQRCATIWEALNAYFAEERPGSAPVLQGASALRQAIAVHLERARRRAEALRRGLADAARADALRRAGELLLAYAGEVRPGQTVLEVEGHSIPLDPERAPLDQARDLFREYRKVRSVQTQQPARLTACEREVEYWAQLLVYAETARTPAELRALRDDLGWTDKAERGAKPRRHTGLSGSIRSEDGFEMLVGRSARHNEEVTFERAQADDLWLHARGVPGAHVIIRSGGREVPPRTLHAAASYAAHYSQAREATSVEVDVTPRRYVKRIAGGPPGLVRYSHERTLRVRPHALPEGPHGH